MLCLYPAVVDPDVGVGAGAGVVVRAGGGTPGRKVAVVLGVCLGVGAGGGPMGRLGVGLGVGLPAGVGAPCVLGGGVVKVVAILTVI